MITLPRSGLTPWKKGQSGNPLGVGKTVAAAITYARSKTKEALQVAEELMYDETVPPRDRLKAVEIILERGLGKAPQLSLTVDASDHGGTKKAVADLARQVFLVLQRGGIADGGDIVDTEIVTRGQLGSGEDDGESYDDEEE